MMHEFEGLLFSDPEGLACGIDRLDLMHTFKAIRSKFDSPEHINDSVTTAPSKRILSLHPAYAKVTDGTLAALEVGLHTMRQACPLFDGWLVSIEQLAPVG